jgi:hypothetical protein
MDENDYFASNDDRHYTQGAHISYLTPAVTSNSLWDQPYIRLSSILPIFGCGDRGRKYEITVGQSILTPKNVLRADPAPKDCPYAAWLYTGAGLLPETKFQDYYMLENVQLLARVVGWTCSAGRRDSKHFSSIYRRYSLIRLAELIV